MAHDSLDALLAQLDLVVDPGFDEHGPDPTVWLPHHLPQWSTPDRSAARWAVVDGDLHLRVEPDQPPWCPAHDGDTRVSSLQTGVRSGPVGSSDGQHRFAPDLRVVTAQPSRTLHATSGGAVVLDARMQLDEHAMAALWMIGTEEVPSRSAEVCVAEVFGRDVRDHHARIGMGVHPFGDPDVADDFVAVDLPVDVRRSHRYAAVWEPGRVTFHVDDRLVRVVDQAPAYPMQVMLGVYDFHPQPIDPARVVPTLVVERFRAYAPRQG